MSKIGKNPILIPTATTVSVSGNTISVKGPKGEIARDFGKSVTVTVADNAVTVAPINTSKGARALWGTTAAHVKNMVKGVNEHFTKKLSLEGIGYKVELQGKNLKFNVGFSHPVLIEVPAGVEAKVEKNLITFTSADKEKLGQFAANVRAIKKPEPYKGKGIRYVGEYVREKQGKKAVG